MIHRESRRKARRSVCALGAWLVLTALSSPALADHHPKGIGVVWIEIVEDDPRDSYFATDEGEYCDYSRFSDEPAQMSLSDIDEELLDELAARDIKVNLAIQAHKLDAYFNGDEDAMDDIAAVIEAGEEGQVRPWLVLSWCDGYFPNSTNVEEYMEAANQLVSWWMFDDGGPHYPATTYIWDMEARWSRGVEIQNSGLFDDLTPLFQEWQDDQEFENARSVYASAVDTLHQLGWTVEVTTNGALIQDLYDGDEGMMKAWGTPLLGIDWDVVSWQLYRSLAQEINPFAMTNYYVYRFLQDAQPLGWFFPSADMGVDIGLTDSGPVFDDGLTYEGLQNSQGTLDEVRLDTQAAIAAGVDREHIAVYSLHGIVEEGGVSELQPPSSSAPPADDLGRTQLLIDGIREQDEEL